MTAERHPCAGRVFRDYHDYSCQRNGTRHEDGKWWCHQHAPSAEKARRQKRNDEWSAERRAADEAKAAADSKAEILSQRLAPLVVRAEAIHHRTKGFRVVGHRFVIINPDAVQP